jgi:hypothetical protein
MVGEEVKARLGKPRHATDLHVPCRVAEWHLAAVVQAAHPPDVCVLKEVGELRAALALHFAYYNFCRVVRTIKTTPAMAAGLAVSRWTVADLLAT